MGYNGGVLSVGTALYPAIGGALAVFGWYYPFFLTLLAIPVGIFSLIFLKLNKLEKSMNLTLYFREVASTLKSTYVFGLFAGIFLTFIILYGGYITFFTMLLDERFGQSSLQIGVILSSSSIITGIISSQLGRLTLRFHEKGLILTAAILYLLIFLIIPSVTNIWWFVLPIVLFGIAQGINIPSLLNLITGYAQKDYRAAFLSVNWMVMRIGQALGPYLLGIVYIWHGIDGTFYFSALAAMMFILVAAIFIQKEKKSTKTELGE